MLLKVLYNLLMIDAVPVKQLTFEKDSPDIDNGRTSTFRSAEQDEFVDVLSPDEGFDGGRLLDSGRKLARKRTDIQEEEKFEIFLGYIDDSSHVGTRFGNTEKNELRPSHQIAPTLQKVPENSNRTANRVTRRASIDMNEIERKQ